MSTDAPKTAAKPREKNPIYDVFRQEANGTWTLLTDPDKGIAAATRRDAITRVGLDLGDGAYGTFATVKHGEFKPTTRGRKTEPTDVWS